MKHGKKYKKALESFENKDYNLNDSIDQAKKTSYSKFSGTLSLHVSLILPKDKDAKSVKGALTFPHPIAQNQEIRIIAFCNEDETEAIKKAGAVEAGLDKLVKKIEDGWMEFDIALASPSVMGQIARLGRQLGPKGLMPSPKNGTLTEDLVKSIEEFKKGKTNFTCDDSGVVHVAVGKTDTDTKNIAENVKSALNQIAETVGKRPEMLVKTMHISPTMGAGVKVNPGSLFTEE